MEPTYLAALQDLLAQCGAATIEPPRLVHFYKHCSRQPIRLNRVPIGVPLKTLLYRYPYLRAPLQECLVAFVAEHWGRFAPETVPPTPDPEMEIDDNDALPVPDVVTDERGAAPVPAPDESPAAADAFAFNPVREDWFDRFLDFVRILLFR
jgi:hypothetical protein